MRAREGGTRARDRDEGVAAGRPTSAVDAADHSLGFAEGAMFPAILLTNLEDRGLIVGVEAELIRPVRGRSGHLLPVGTILYGVATYRNERFALSFKRAKLKDETQLEVHGVAYDAGGTHGIPPTRWQEGVALLVEGEKFKVLFTRPF
jgi:hypothetical protein